MPALDLTEPGHLLAKLEYECQALLADNGNSYAAVNALRDAYHLSDWIWASRLKRDSVLQVTMMGATGDRWAWFAWVKQQFRTFPSSRSCATAPSISGPEAEHREDDPPRHSDVRGRQPHPPRHDAVAALAGRDRRARTAATQHHALKAVAYSDIGFRPGAPSSGQARAEIAGPLAEFREAGWLPTAAHATT